MTKVILLLATFHRHPGGWHRRALVLLGLPCVLAVSSSTAPKEPTSRTGQICSQAPTLSESIDVSGRGG